MNSTVLTKGFTVILNTENRVVYIVVPFNINAIINLKIIFKKWRC